MTRSPIIFDIETWVDWDFVRRPEFIEPLEQAYAPPATHKTGVAIAAHHTDWWAKMRKGWTFNPLAARVCSIALGWMHRDEVYALATEDERELLGWFAACLRDRGQCALSGYNVRRFDVPFLTIRAAIHGIDLPAWWPHDKDYRGIIDLFDVTGGGKLDQWLLRFDIPQKTADGSKVEFMSLEAIEEYNRHDVMVERELARRLAPNVAGLREWTGEPLQPQELY